MYLALKDVLDPQTEVDKIILVRSVVATRDVGHLPGTLEEKTQIYERPYKNILHDLMGRANTYQDMKDAGMITFDTTSFIRGMTFDNAVIVVDEGQNMTFHEINSIMTRLGNNSRVIFVGDLIQTDLRKHRSDVSGMEDAMKVAGRMSRFSTVTFTKHDIVRSEFVKEWITATEDEGIQ
jgi:phosphate starvation-inducible protein PhoH